MPDIFDDFKDVLGERPDISKDFGDVLGGLPFDPPSVGEPPVQAADFSQATPQELTDIRARRPIQEGQENVLGRIDRFFGVPESLDEAGVEQVPRGLLRAGVGAVGFLPTLAERLARPPEGQSTLDVAGEEVAGLGGMLGRFPLQMRMLALKSLGADPDQPLNPADQAIMSLTERITGKKFSEFNREIEQGLLQAPEEPFFSAMIGAGGVRGGAKLTKRLQKVKEPPPTRIGEVQEKVTLPEAKPSIEKLPIQEVPKPTTEKVAPVEPKKIGLLTDVKNVAQGAKEGISRLTKPSPFEKEIHQRYLTTARNADAEIFLAHEKTRAWTKTHKSKIREDAGAIIEGTENLKTGKKPKRSAETMKFVKESREFLESSRQKVNDFLRDTGREEYISFLENYIPHFYVGGKTKVTGALKKWMSSPNAKRRKIPTLKEATKLGLAPISQDVAVLGQMWNEINWKVAANIKTADLFKNIRHPETRQRMVIRGDKPAPDWKFYDHPALNKTFGRKVGDKVLLQKSGVWVHPELQRVADIAFSDPLAARGKIARAYDLANAYAKTGVLTLSGFHAIALTESAQAVLATAKNPVPALLNLTKEGFGRPSFRLGKKLQKTRPDLIADFIKDGLELGEARADVGYTQVRKHLAELEAKTRGNPLMNLPVKVLHGNFKLVDNILWNQIHTGNKIWGHYKTLQSELSKLPESATPEQITVMRQRVAEVMNDAFGGQEWRSKLWVSPEGLMFARRILLAPDWTLSNINIAGKTLAEIKNPIVRRKHLKYWRNMALSIFGATQSLNYWSTGHFTWDNELGHKMDIDITALKRFLAKNVPGYEFDPTDKTRHYVRLAKQAREVMSWMQTPDALFTSKSSPIAKEVIKQVFSVEPGSIFPPEWTQKDVTFFESIPLRIKSMAQAFTPFSLRGNNFAFSLPMSKGMTKFKTIRAYQRALEGKTWRVMGRPANQDETLRAIHDAATQNGLNSKQLFHSAKAAVVGRYYDEFWKAYENENTEKMNEVAKILASYGVTRERIEQSAKRRGITLREATR